MEIKPVDTMQKQNDMVEKKQGILKLIEYIHNGKETCSIVFINEIKKEFMDMDTKEWHDYSVIDDIQNYLKNKYTPQTFK
jgi:hypothetical protein